MKQQTENWRDKISNHAQFGGIETAVLDNGAGRGTRIAWVNTGAGLRYKVVIDRAMDIAEASFNQYNLSWISHLGTSGPEPFSDRGVEWLRTFGGGLVVTCGLSHVGPPESDETGERGLHGRISNQPAEIISIVQPDPVNGKMEMHITGRIRESRVFGPNLELERTISGTLGEPIIRIHDAVVNVANTPAPHMLLYHCNFGWPLADEGADMPRVEHHPLDHDHRDDRHRTEEGGPQQQDLKPPTHHVGEEIDADHINWRLNERRGRLRQCDADCAHIGSRNAPAGAGRRGDRAGGD